MRAPCPFEPGDANSPPDFAEATLVPAPGNGPTQAELAFAMANSLIGASLRSRAVVLKSLREIFPHSPLTVRAAALGALARRQASLPGKLTFRDKLGGPGHRRAILRPCRKA